jgi:3-oxoadipate enol-lactonase
MGEMTEHHWTEREAVSLHYTVDGTGSSLLLIHELSGTSDSWNEVVPLLGDGYRVLRPDQRGAGLSEKVRTHFTVADLAADTVATIAAADLRPPITIVGLASGAAIAVEVAARLGADVAHLVLCSPALRASPSRRSYLLDRAEQAKAQGMRTVIDLVFERSYPPDLIRDHRVYDEYRARFLAIDPVCYALANAMLADIDVSAAIAAVESPVLVLAGAKDQLRPADRVRVEVATFADCELRVVDDSGHIMTLQRPDAVAAAVRDLQSSVTPSIPRALD